MDGARAGIARLAAAEGARIIHAYMSALQYATSVADPMRFVRLADD